MILTLGSFMVPYVDVSPMFDSRGWGVLLPEPGIHIANRAAADMCTESVGHSGRDGENNNDGF